VRASVELEASVIDPGVDANIVVAYHRAGERGKANMRELNVPLGLEVALMWKEYGMPFAPSKFCTVSLRKPARASVLFDVRTAAAWPAPTWKLDTNTRQACVSCGY
jgi:hypothetical protein